MKWLIEQFTKPKGKFMAETAVNSKHFKYNQTQEMTLSKSNAEHNDYNAINVILHSNLLNFAIVIVFLIWLAKKADLSALIAKKQGKIIESISNAEDEKKIKQNHLHVVKNKISNVEQEVLKIIDEGEQVANNLSENILEDAEKQSKDMLHKAKLSINNEKQMVSGEVETKITTAAFYIAEKHIKQAIDERLHTKYINEFIDNLDKVEN